MSVVRKINSGRQPNSEEDMAQSDKAAPYGKRKHDPITDSDSYDEADPVMGPAPKGRVESPGTRGKGEAKETTQVAKIGTSPNAPKSGLNIHGNAGKMHGSTEKAKYFSNALKQAHNTWKAPGQNGHFSDGANAESDNPFNSMNPMGREPSATPIGDMMRGGGKNTPRHSGAVDSKGTGPVGRPSGGYHAPGKQGKSLSPSTKEGKRPAIKYAAAGGND